MTEEPDKIDYLQYYDLEAYLFGTVGPRFRAQGYLSAVDFFCIVIWKANRAKSIIAHKLNPENRNDLEDVVRELTTDIVHAETPRGKVEILVTKWHLHLPMVSAILTVLYPDDFTIYDVRVVEIVDKDESAHLSQLKDITDCNLLWQGYEKYMRRVNELAPTALCLRDKDRYLWGKSFYCQLQRDVREGFPKNGG